MKNVPAMLCVTNASFDHGRLTDLGYTEDGRTFWRLDVSTLMAHMRAGQLYVVHIGERVARLMIEWDNPHDEPRLTVAGQGCGCHFLRDLPPFKD
jgi:hypothetical protein